MVQINCSTFMTLNETGGITLRILHANIAKIPTKPLSFVKVVRPD